MEGNSFQFSNPHQLRIYQTLHNLVGPGPAAFFKDACYLMENQHILQSTAHLVFHLLREIESAIRRVLRSVTQTQPEKAELYELLKKLIGGVDKIIRDHFKDSTTPNISFMNDIKGKIKNKLKEAFEPSHKDEIKSILKSLKISSDSPEAKAWFILSEQLHRVAHRSALDNPRPVDEIQDLWEQAQKLFEILLSKIQEELSVKWFSILDDLVEKPQPTLQDVKRLKNEIPNTYVIRKYFFDRLQDPRWLKLLKKKGFFQYPPKAIQDEEQRTISFTPWPESRYLARMAKYDPELIASIIQEMEDTDNVLVQANLIDAMLTMPPQVAAQLVDKAKRWAEMPLGSLPEKIAELIIYLARGGKSDTALEIACVLLDILPSKRNLEQLSAEPSTRFDIWEYEQIIKKYILELALMVGMPVLELLCDLLEKAICFSITHEEFKGLEDYSIVWQPAIEDNPQNYSHKVKNVLVSGIRNIAEILIRSRKLSIAKVVETLESRQWKIFHRIALYLLKIFDDEAVNLIRERLTNHELFDDVYIQCEYVLLLRSCFTKLSVKDQESILEWIEAGPNKIEDAEELEIWQRNRLSWIGQEALPKEWQNRYQELIDKYGKPEHSEFPVYQEVRWVTPSSPKSKEEFASKSVEDIVKFLKNWEPPENVFDEPCREGLGQVLKSVVSEDPVHFAAKATSFQGLDPTYVRALISGLEESLKQKKTFEWYPVLQLCQWVVEQSREIPGRRVYYHEADPDWGWTRKEIARLFSTGFEDIDGAIPFELRKNVWRILQPLTDDPEPTSEYEEKYGGANMDPATLSLNTVRGMAMHAVIRYALWVRRNINKKQSTQQQLQHNFEEMPEVRGVLESHLDIQKEPSVAIRAVYGFYFPQLVLLDHEWAKSRASLIFPMDNQEYFDAAWNTYVTFCKADDQVFEILREQYHYAANRIGTHAKEERMLTDPDKKLSEHLMAFYWRGKLSLQDPLLSTFWEKATDDLCAYAISFIGHALQNTPKPIPTEVLKRLKKLWKTRLEIAKQNPGKHKKEIAAFGWWFISDKFDTDWAIKQLREALDIAYEVEADIEVVEKLAELSTEYPLEAVHCLEMMVKGEQKDWNIYSWRDYARKILSVALQKGEKVSAKAKRIINYLVSRGWLEFRDLLE